MNNNTTDLSAGGIFVYAYDASTRTVQFSVKDGLNCKVKIPTDEEFQSYVKNTWNTAQKNYDNTDPVMNYLLSNDVETSPLSVRTSSLSKKIVLLELYI